MLAVSAIAAEPVKVVVEILGKSEVTIDSSRCAWSEVEASLKEYKTAAPDVVVLIVTKSDADQATVSNVMAACRKIGIQRFSFQPK